MTQDDTLRELSRTLIAVLLQEQKEQAQMGWEVGQATLLMSQGLSPVSCMALDGPFHP